MQADLTDDFLADYLRTVSDDLLPDPEPGFRRSHLNFAPPEPVALGGLVVLDDRADQGWVTINAGQIEAYSSSRPSDVACIDTEGVILPGLLDLHNHPDFNVMPAWEPPQVYDNRYQWRGSPLYDQLVGQPNQRMKKELINQGGRLRYAEIRAMVGGVTAIQGMNGTGSRDEALVRNVDRWIFGQHKARTLIDLPAKVGGFGWDDFARKLEGIQSGAVDTLYVHLAEGRRQDATSMAEFEKLKEFGGLSDATVVIHGTALTADQFKEMADVRAKLVWSPQSNLRLYRETTDIKAALDSGVRVALGADWLPSGSVSLLGEMQVAANEMAYQGVAFTAEDLVRMVTRGAAEIAGLSDFLGKICPQRPADLTVLRRRHEDAFESVLKSGSLDVDIVLIGGDVTYIRKDLLDQFPSPAEPRSLQPVTAWGRRMLLDNGFRAKPVGDPVPSLDDLRADLIRCYPQVGPIWA